MLSYDVACTFDFSDVRRQLKDRKSQISGITWIKFYKPTWERRDNFSFSCSSARLINKLGIALFGG